MGYSGPVVTMQFGLRDGDDRVVAYTVPPAAQVLDLCLGSPTHHHQRRQHHHRAVGLRRQALMHLALDARRRLRRQVTLHGS